MMVCALVLTGCSSSRDPKQSSSHEFFGYAIDDYLVTTNAGSNEGVSTNAHQLAGRLYPGVYVTGPKGQRIPNTDLVQARPLPGETKRLQLRISDKAQYSDGAPVTCDSFLLTQVAATTRPMFDSSMPLHEQVERVECVPGTKLATVVFKHDFGPRWRQLFAAGTLMPAHAIARKLNMDLPKLNEALNSGDPARLQPIADIWNHGFDLGVLDPILQVSAGPFKVDSVGPEGEVTLVRNENYYGEKAVNDKLVLWPKGTDLKRLATEGNLQLAEVDAVRDSNWVDRNDPKNPYRLKTTAGILSEQLVLATAGVFYDVENRRAFAACVDQAKLAEVSSQESGVELKPTLARTVRPEDPVIAHFHDIIDHRVAVDIPTAERLRGQIVRIGYYGTDERKAAMVRAIADSCAPAGITVVDVSVGAQALNMLSETFTNAAGFETYTEGGADAILQAVDPMFWFPHAPRLSDDIEAARAAEHESWELMQTIPIAPEPRVFIVDKTVRNVVENTDLYGIGWNMDRWQEENLHN
ncbi:ABC transporter substrate-binding protein [Corynebacterium felinum]|nr:ABC transporter substrate-binding protein [Corynebacterium felinum]MDF5821909.1 ABC transporter substrate-binding protein [Corynebacterium felinum]